MFLLVLSDTKHWGPQMLAQYFYAVDQGKDILVALKAGQELPMEMFSGANVVAVEHYEDGSKESVHKCAEYLIREWEKRRRKNDETDGPERD